MGKLSQRLEIEATPWKPQDESPDTIEGVVLEVSTRWMQGEGSRAGRDVPYVEVQDENDDTVVWGVLALHRVLESELTERRQIQAGDLIAIKYLGKPEGKDYVAYRVAHEERGPRRTAVPAASPAAPPAADYEPF